MLELFGREYVIDHLCNAARAEQEERAYRIYVTDALGAFALIKERWCDHIPELYDKPEPKPVSTKEWVRKFSEWLEEGGEED